MEVRSARPPANRAVAALQSAAGNTAVPLSALLSDAAFPPHPAQDTKTATPGKASITRYQSFDALCQAQQKPDELAELRVAIQRKLPQPSPRNEVLAVGEPVTVKILQLLDPLSKDALAFGETCRAVRAALLRTTDLESVALSPAIMPVAALTSEDVRSAVRSFFSARGGEVRGFALHRVDAGTVATHTTLSGDNGTTEEAATWRPQLPALWGLQLIGSMPYLVELDLRHVRWAESAQSQVVPHLFNDLHLVAAGTLRTLKVDATMMPYWSVGWWRRHVNLSALTVGSRYTYPVSGTDASSSMTSPEAASLLDLPPDFFALMREEGRQWTLKLWSPLKPIALLQMLSPASGVSYGGVTALLLNVRCNAAVCEWVGSNTAVAGVPNLGADEATGGAATAVATESPAETKVNAKARKAAAQAEAPPEAVIPFLQLRRVTVVDVAERPEAAAEVYQALRPLAPQLTCFSVTNTVAVGSGGAGRLAGASKDGAKANKFKRAATDKLAT